MAKAGWSPFFSPALRVLSPCCTIIRSLADIPGLKGNDIIKWHIEYLHLNEQVTITDWLFSMRSKKNMKSFHTFKHLISIQCIPSNIVIFQSTFDSFQFFHTDIAK